MPLLSPRHHVLPFLRISKVIINPISKNFISVHNQPDLYTGQQARFGGKVINVINTKNDTLLEIAVLPLNDSAKPQIDASYQGRILAQQKGFLDR